MMIKYIILVLHDMDVSARLVENGNIRSINSYSALKIMELRRAIIMLAKIVVYIIFGRD